MHDPAPMIVICHVLGCGESDVDELWRKGKISKSHYAPRFKEIFYVSIFDLLESAIKSSKSLPKSITENAEDLVDIISMCVEYYGDCEYGYFCSEVYKFFVGSGKLLIDDINKGLYFEISRVVDLYIFLVTDKINSYPSAVLRKGRARDSSVESSVVTGLHQQTPTGLTPVSPDAQAVAV